ncbi:Sec-independent protein translocase protein TatB [Frateuria terrea]|uniref:Sec-independent protein translocase protein TatB n=1 Tax=Frateuria terrea TaxID=529704 RepID=A0A1H6X490_9GAMM|nr:Sec-independent protein translocase protein TatB [Frateuria terrea]SEJ19850.1 sec-independent protein translocase protein TatB [Frateuria terrea]SFP57559.1 sec-independent protein translocase protein TatB [Frateuria terrea]
MIEISFGKLLLLALIALLVLGPEKLPGAARTAGALVRRMRGTWESVRAEVERELQVEEIKRTAREAAARAEAAQEQMNATAREVRKAVGVVTAVPADEAPVELEDQPLPQLTDETGAEADLFDAPPPERDTRTGDLFAEDPEHAPVKEHPHGLA